MMYIDRTQQTCYPVKSVRFCAGKGTVPRDIPASAPYFPFLQASESPSLLERLCTCQHEQVSHDPARVPPRLYVSHRLGCNERHSKHFREYGFYLGEPEARSLAAW